MAMMTSIAYRERRQLTRLPSSNGLRVHRHHPTPPRVLRYRAGGLPKKRGANLCPLAKASLLPIVRCTLRRAERGNVVRSRLYSVGYVTVYPGHCENVSSALARLSPTPVARGRTQVAPRETTPPRSSCFVSVNQHPRYLRECVKGRFSEVRSPARQKLRKEGQESGTATPISSGIHRLWYKCRSERASVCSAGSANLSSGRRNKGGSSDVGYSRRSKGR